ncbi:Leo1-like protein, partial [Backusella circina FSU 941]
KLESNAHLVEWEDGRVSLMLGTECFDVSVKPMGDHEHAYLLAHQTGSGALESQTEFTDHMTFRPSGLKSDTHRHLTAQIADKQVKKNKTKMYFTEKNPELVKQELENQENERLRAQKKLE